MVGKNFLAAPKIVSTVRITIALNQAEHLEKVIKKMGAFTCKGCEKRYVGCHSHCEKYIREKAAHEERKAAEDKEKAISVGLYQQRAAAVYKAMRRKYNKGR